MSGNFETGEKARTTSLSFDLVPLQALEHAEQFLVLEELSWLREVMGMGPGVKPTGDRGRCRKTGKKK